MTDLPIVAILFMTKEHPERAGVAATTLEGLSNYLRYDGKLLIVIADGNSSGEYTSGLLEIAKDIGDATIVSVDGFPGRVWNHGLTEAFQHAPVYLRLEDDFVLQQPLNITTYVDVLMKNEQVGMIRLGLMPAGSALQTIGYDGEIYFNFLRSTQYAYSGNPGLIHKRFHDFYGWYDEHLDPGKIEVALDDIVRRHPGPEIWWPLFMARYGTYGAWAHIGSVKSYV